MKTNITQSKYKNSPNAVLAISLISYLIIVLDISIVITGLPDIKESLHFTPVGLSWVQNAYLLCFGGFLLLGARMSDLLGRRRMLIVGLGIFTISSLMIGASQSAILLIVSRALQGIGAAILAPTVLSQITATFPEGSQRTKALAYYSMVAGAGATLGLVLGGILADQISWRVGFFINVPIGISLIFAAIRLLVESEYSSGSFDILGTITSTLGMGALVYSIVRSAEYGWSDSITLAAMISSLVLLLIFFINESRVEYPLMPLHLFAHRIRLSGYIGRMLFLGAMVSFFFFSTQFMQSVLGFSPLLAGIGFLPITLPTFAAAMTVPALTKILGNGRLLCIALAFMSAGMFWLSRANADADFLLDIALPMILIGIGNGAGIGPLTVASMTGVSKQDHGAASGIVNVAHQLGGTLGLGILVAVYAAADTPALTGSELLSHRIFSAMTGGAIMLTMAMIITAVMLLPFNNRLQKSSVTASSARIKIGNNK